MYAELSAPLAARLLLLARQRSAETSLHTAADRYVNAMIVAVMYGLLRAKKALQSASDEDAAISAMHSALEESLPPVLLKTIAAGGEAGVAGLRKLRLAGAPTTTGAEVFWRRAAELRTAKPAPKKPLGMKFNVTDPNVVKAAKKHAAKLITDITKTTRKRIHDAIVGAVEGDGFKKAYQTILDAVGDKDRARLIARNETFSAVAEGNRLSWDQAVDNGLLNGDEKVVWITTPIGACPECEALDGTTRDLDGTFEDGAMIPLHVNCRCVESIVS